MEKGLIKNGLDVFIKLPFSVMMNSWYSWPRISQNHEIKEELRLEDHSVQPPSVQRQVNQIRVVWTVSSLILNTCKDEDSAASLGNQSQCLTALDSKNAFSAV